MRYQQKKFGFGFGVLPYSSTGFNLQTNQEFNDENSIDTRLYAANGGVNRVFLSIGFPLTKFLSFGLTSNYNFGKFEYESFNLYEGVNYGIYSNSSSDISGFNYQFSSNIDIPIKKDLNFNINNTFHHVGIYSFRYDALRKFVSMSPSKNEITIIVQNQVSTCVLHR